MNKVELVENKVSVIIPTYNRANAVCRCIDSVLNQTYNNIEIIVVDDGSTDNTCELLRNKYSNRIILLEQKNQGPSSARNRGIEKATGKWIMFVDSDDYLLSNGINLLFQDHNDDVDLVVAGIMGKYSSREVYFGPEKKGILMDSDIKKEIMYLVSNRIYFDDNKIDLKSIEGPVAKLYRRKNIVGNNIKFPEDMLYAEDIIFNYIYLQFTERIRYINVPIYCTVRHEESLASQATLKMQYYSKFKEYIDNYNVKNIKLNEMLNYRRCDWMLMDIENIIKKNNSKKNYKEYIKKYKRNFCEINQYTHYSRVKKLELQLRGETMLYIVAKCINIIKNKIR